MTNAILLKKNSPKVFFIVSAYNEGYWKKSSLRTFYRAEERLNNTGIFDFCTLIIIIREQFRRIEKKVFNIIKFNPHTYTNDDIFFKLTNGEFQGM